MYKTSNGNYRDLKIWQTAMDNVVRVYGLTEKFSKSELFGLVSQMRRAAVSIPANIAEGYARKGKELRQFLAISLGSSTELETHILLANKLGYISNDIMKSVLDEIEHTGRMITNFIKTLQ